MAGLTTSGLTIRTQPEIQALLEAAVDGEFPGLNIRAGIVQQIIGVMSEELALNWEVLQALYGAAYPDSATGILLDQVAALTGTRRRAATSSRVFGTVSLNAGVTLPAGSIAAVLGAPDQQFATIVDVTNGFGVPADIDDVVFEALVTGPVSAPTGSLTVIVTPVSGWTGVTNPAAAEVGKLVATDAELREQRVIELAGAGSGTLASIRAAVARVDLVQQVTAYENAASSVDGDGRPGKSFEIVVWDGATLAADSDVIAQTIHDRKPAGIEVHGVGSSGTATTDDGDEVTIDFTRATALRVYVDAVVVLAPGTGGGYVALAQEAVSAKGATYDVGQTAYASQLICALLEVPGIVAVTSLTIGLIATPVTSSVVADYDEIVRINGADVDVTT